MKSSLRFFAVILTLSGATVAVGQGKGVDTQNQRITDASSNKAPANNGAKTNVGTTGSGINFGKDKTRERGMLPNPYRLTARRDAIVKSVAEVMRDRKLILDEASSKLEEGILVSQPYTFIKGAVVTQAELNRYASIITDNTRNWTRGRYTIMVEVQPIDGASANISVNAKIEGRTDGPTGGEWITLPSSGAAEQDFLNALIENVTGASPATSKNSREIDLKASVVLVNSATKIVSVDVSPNSVVINANPKSTRN
ncbi:MAG: hypothetical protein ABR607_06115 [Pyrinomonadaceae bacterium]